MRRIKVIGVLVSCPKTSWKNWSKTRIYTLMEVLLHSVLKVIRKLWLKYM